MELNEILFQTYKKYVNIGHFKKPSIAKSKIYLLNGQYQQQITKYLYYLNSESLLVSEKDKLSSKIKKFYMEYVLKTKYYPEINNDVLVQKIDELLNVLAQLEAEKIENIFKKYNAKCDVYTYFQGKGAIKSLMFRHADKLIEEELIRTNQNANEQNIEVFITEKGERYHKKDCPFCKGKSLMPVLLTVAEDKGLKPCRCFELNLKSKIEESPDLYNKNYATVFIDESIRPNIWHKIDPTLPKEQSVYSYLICSGFLTNDNQITNENLHCADVGTVFNTNKVQNVTMETITIVLSQLLITGFSGNVVIYVDNKKAKNTWGSLEENKRLQSLFESVNVRCIPREMNKKADKLGRNRAVANIPANLAGKIIETYATYEKIADIVTYNKNLN